MSRVGRRPKWSPERETAILNALRVGNTRTASAEAAGIHRDTFYVWMEDPTFSDAVRNAEAEAELRFLGQIAKHAAKSPQAAQWWLEHRRREEYGAHVGVELTGANGGPIEMLELASFNDHETVALAELAREELRRRAEEMSDAPG